MKRLCRHIQFVEQPSTLITAQAMGAGTEQRDDASQIHLAPQKTYRGRGCALVTHRAAEAEALGVFGTQYVTPNAAWFAWVVGHMQLATTVGTTQLSYLFSNITIELKKIEPETGIHGY